MIRTRFIFPLMFTTALSASAFTKFKSNFKKDSDTAYFYDYSRNSCKVVQMDDTDCTVDNVGYVCREYVPDYGWMYMFQSGFGSACWQPYYAYFQIN